jgi:hypothetical protein
VQWREKFWTRRYRAIVVSGEEGAQRERLKYVLSHGAKEGLVSTPLEWPGAHALRPLLTGEPVTGIWFDRTQEYAARRRGEDFERLCYATPYTVTLSPLPCWEDLSPELQKKRIEEIAREIEAESKARLEERGVPPLGPDAIRRQSPDTIPPRSKKSPAPLFLAASTPTTPSSPPSARRRTSSKREIGMRSSRGDLANWTALGDRGASLESDSTSQ